MSSQYGELWPTSGWDRLTSLGHPCKFHLVSRLGFVTAATSLYGSQPNFTQCFALTGAVRLHIYFRQLLLRNGIFPGAKFTLRPPHLALSYWQHYYMAVEVEQWTPAKLCGIEHRAPPIFGRVTITLGIGPHFKRVIMYWLITSLSMSTWQHQHNETDMDYCERKEEELNRWEWNQSVWYKEG